MSISSTIQFWIWTAIIGIAALFELNAIIYEWRNKPHNDKLTLTHWLAVEIPMTWRVVILAFLAYHFLWLHKSG